MRKLLIGFLEFMETPSGWVDRSDLCKQLIPLLRRTVREQWTSSSSKPSSGFNATMSFHQREKNLGVTDGNIEVSFKIVTEGIYATMGRVLSVFVDGEELEFSEREREDLSQQARKFIRQTLESSEEEDKKKASAENAKVAKKLRGFGR